MRDFDLIVYIRIWFWSNNQDSRMFERHDRRLDHSVHET